MAVSRRVKLRRPSETARQKCLVPRRLGGNAAVILSGLRRAFAGEQPDAQAERGERCRKVRVMSQKRMEQSWGRNALPRRIREVPIDRVEGRQRPRPV